MTTKYSGFALESQIEIGTVGLSSQPVEKTVAFTGAAGVGAVGTVALFTVTGTVLVKLFGVCTELLASAGGGTISVGTTGGVAGLLGVQTATDIDASEIWVTAALSTTPITAVSGVTAYILCNSNAIFATIATGDITDGTITFYLTYVPLSDGAKVVAA